MRRALPNISRGWKIVSGLMGQKKSSFGQAMVKKIEFLAKNRTFYPHFCENNRVIVHTLITATARRPPVDHT